MRQIRRGQTWMERGGRQRLMGVDYVKDGFVDLYPASMAPIETMRALGLESISIPCPMFEELWDMVDEGPEVEEEVEA